MINRTTASLALAGAMVTAQPALAASTSTGGEWENVLSPLFLWGISIDGTASIGDQTADLDLDFQDDILESMEAVWTIRYEARNDRMGLFLEYQYANIKPEVEIGPVSADVDFKQTLFEAGMAYAVNNSDTTRLEVLGGVRYTKHDINVDASVQLPPLAWLPPNADIEVNGGDDWIHPFLGLRVDHSISDKWSFIGRADYGFGGEDNTAANLNALFNYRFNDWGAVMFGYRYLEHDYDNGKFGLNGYALDGNQQGPLVGLNIYW